MCTSKRIENFEISTGTATDQACTAVLGNATIPDHVQTSCLCTSGKQIIEHTPETRRDGLGQMSMPPALCNKLCYKRYSGLSLALSSLYRLPEWLVLTEHPTGKVCCVLRLIVYLFPLLEFVLIFLFCIVTPNPSQNMIYLAGAALRWEARRKPPHCSRLFLARL